MAEAIEISAGTAARVREGAKTEDRPVIVARVPVGIGVRGRVAATSTEIVARVPVGIVVRGRVAATSTEIVARVPVVAVRITAPGTKADVHSPA